LRELVGNIGSYREEAMEDASSELSELESVAEEELEKKKSGRPNFVRAATGADRRVESTQDFFRRGNRNGHGNGVSNNDENFFATPDKTAMRGALAQALSAAATSSPQQVGTALDSSEGAGMESSREPCMAGSKEMGGMDVGMEVTTADWAEEVANQSGDGMEGMEGMDRSMTATPTPTPARRTTPTPVPVTPTKGKKRIAVSTPRPVRFGRHGARAVPVGFAAASALEQILAAVAEVERKADARLAMAMADTEEREKRLAVKLLAMEALETDAMERGRWEIKQWQVWAKEMGERKEELREIKATVDGVVQQLAGLVAKRTAPPEVSATPQWYETATEMGTPPVAPRAAVPAVVPAVPRAAKTLRGSAQQ
jgi:hypothetical protein